MKLSFVDWVGLLANIVTILGISGFLTNWISKRNAEKRAATSLLSNAIKSATMALDIYSFKDGNIPHITKYIKELKNQIKQESEDIHNMVVDTDWKQEDQYQLPRPEECLDLPIDYQEVTEEEPPTDFVFTTDSGGEEYTESTMLDYLKSFKQQSATEQELLLKSAIYNDLVISQLRTIDGLPIEVLQQIIEKILNIVAKEGDIYNQFLAKEFDNLSDIQLKINELMKYTNSYIDTIFKHIQSFENPFLIFQEKWRNENKLPVTFTTEDYARKKLIISDKIIELLDRVLENLPK